MHYDLPKALTKLCVRPIFSSIFQPSIEGRVTVLRSGYGTTELLGIYGTMGSGDFWSAGRRNAGAPRFAKKACSMGSPAALDDTAHDFVVENGRICTRQSDAIVGFVRFVHEINISNFSEPLLILFGCSSYL